MDPFLTPASINVTGVTLHRKRSRDSSSFNQPLLGVNISSQIYQQQSEIDRLIVEHTEKVRSEIEEMRKRNAARLISSVHETIIKQLKTKDDEILQIGRINFSLEEKIKSLSMENQLLKQLVQNNEATANALRNKLQQVLVQLPRHHNADNATVMVDDAQSYCGSNYEEDYGGKRKGNNESRYCRQCRKCGKEESCVLLLPCRHLCVCRVCVSSVSVCPVCNAAKSAGVVVNMSSS
ncbi:putative BOI-related E3 ubiquitin-protein ligase 3 [Bidens hawaiensis]|uniref:putative BOI-related E3 ubiquitin-protein ligase 3 n=1 Tax=Bidens hawaiensis TaxID=980011 RepID=UPI00404A2110